MDAPSFRNRAFLAFAAGLSLFLGVALRMAPLAAFAFAVVLLLATSRAGARRRLAHLAARRSVAAGAFEDDEVRVEIALENRGKAPVSLVQIVDSFGAALAEGKAMLDPGPLRPGRRHRLAYRTVCSRLWGVYTVGPLALSVADPLGLHTARRVLPDMRPFDLFPRVHPVGGLEQLGARTSFAPSETLAARAGASAVYLGVRDFRPGDDVRRIHWPATARCGAPMVREHERDMQPRLTLFLDLDRRARAGLGRKSTLEYLVRVGSSLMWTAHRRGDAFSLVAEGERSVVIPAAQGQAHLATVLHELVVAKQAGSCPLSALVERHREFVLPDGMAVLLIGTTEIDLDALGAVLGSLRAKAAQPVVVAIDAPAFTQVDRPPVPAAAARALRAALIERLLELDVPGAVLGPDDTPEERLLRPDFLSLARPTEAGS